MSESKGSRDLQELQEEIKELQQTQALQEEIQDIQDQEVQALQEKIQSLEEVQTLQRQPLRESDFEFYLKFAKPLVLNLRKPDDRVLAAAWIQKLRDETAGDLRLRTDYLKLLLFVLQRNKLIGIFSENPADYNTLDEFPSANLYDVARGFLEKENAYRMQNGLTSPGGDFPPYSTEYSADLLEYSAAQDIPNFGVHAYYAISNEPLTNWNKTEKAVLPRGAISVSDRTAARLGTPSRISTTVSEPTIDSSRTPKSKSKSQATPRSRSSSPKGRQSPSANLGGRPEVDDRSPPTWGSNLIDVSEPPVRDIFAEPSELQDELPDYLLEQGACIPCNTLSSQKGVSFAEEGQAPTSDSSLYASLPYQTPPPQAPTSDSSLYASLPYQTPPPRSPYSGTNYTVTPAGSPSYVPYSPDLPSGEASQFFSNTPPSFFDEDTPPPCSPGYRSRTSPASRSTREQRTPLDESDSFNLDNLEDFDAEGAAIAGLYGTTPPRRKQVVDNDLETFDRMIEEFEKNESYCPVCPAAEMSSGHPLASATQAAPSEQPQEGGAIPKTKTVVGATTTRVAGPFAKGASRVRKPGIVPRPTRSSQLRLSAKGSATQTTADSQKTSVPSRPAKKVGPRTKGVARIPSTTSSRTSTSTSKLPSGISETSRSAEDSRTSVKKVSKISRTIVSRIPSAGSKIPAAGVSRTSKIPSAAGSQIPAAGVSRIPSKTSSQQDSRIPAPGTSRIPSGKAPTRGSRLPAPLANSTRGEILTTEAPESPPYSPLFPEGDRDPFFLETPPSFLFDASMSQISTPSRASPYIDRSQGHGQISDRSISPSRIQSEQRQFSPTGRRSPYAEQDLVQDQDQRQSPQRSPTGGQVTVQVSPSQKRSPARGSPPATGAPYIDPDMLQELGLDAADLKDDVFNLDDLNISQITVTSEEIEYDENDDFDLKDRTIDEELAAFERQIAELEAENAEDIALYGSPDKSVSPIRSPVSQKTSPRKSPAVQAQSPQRSPAAQIMSPRKSPMVQAASPRRSPGVQQMEQEIEYYESPRKSPAVQAQSPQRSPAAQTMSPRKSPMVQAASPRRSPGAQQMEQEIEYYESPRKSPAVQAQSPQRSPAAQIMSPRKSPMVQAASPRRSPGAQQMEQEIEYYESPRKSPAVQAQSPQRSPAAQIMSPRKSPMVQAASPRRSPGAQQIEQVSISRISRIPAAGVSRIPAAGGSRIPAAGGSRIPTAGVSRIPAAGVSRIPSRTSSQQGSRIPARGASRIPSGTAPTRGSRLPEPLANSTAAEILTTEALEPPPYSPLFPEGDRDPFFLETPPSFLFDASMSQISTPSRASPYIDRSQGQLISDRSISPSRIQSEQRQFSPTGRRSPYAGQDLVQDQDQRQSPQRSPTGEQVSTQSEQRVSPPSGKKVVQVSPSQKRSPARGSPPATGGPYIDPDMLQELGLDAADLADDAFNLDDLNISQITVTSDEIEYENDDFDLKDRTIDEELAAFERQIAELEAENAEDIALYGSPDKSVSPIRSPVGQKASPRKSPAVQAQSPRRSPAAQIMSPRKSPMVQAASPRRSPAAQQMEQDMEYYESPRKSPAVQAQSPRRSPTAQIMSPRRSPAAQQMEQDMEYYESPRKSPAVQAQSPRRSPAAQIMSPRKSPVVQAASPRRSPGAQQMEQVSVSRISRIPAAGGSRIPAAGGSRIPAAGVSRIPSKASSQKGSRIPAPGTTRIPSGSGMRRTGEGGAPTRGSGPLATSSTTEILTTQAEEAASRQLEQLMETGQPEQIIIEDEQSVYIEPQGDDEQFFDTEKPEFEDIEDEYDETAVSERSPAAARQDVIKQLRDFKEQLTERQESSPAEGGVPVTTPRRSPSPKRTPTRIQDEGQYFSFEIPSDEGPYQSMSNRLNLESPPHDYYDSPEAQSPAAEVVTTLPEPFDLPEVKRFSPMKRSVAESFYNRQIEQIGEEAEKQLKELEGISGKDDEEINLYVQSERRDLAKRAARLAHDIPDTFQPSHQLAEWELPQPSEEVGILEETPPPCASPGSGSPISPISPIYSPRFKRSIQEHQYTDRFFDKDRPQATSHTIKSGSKTVRLQRKSRRPPLEDIEEPITEEQPCEDICATPKTPYYGNLPPVSASSAKTPDHLHFESPPQEYYASPDSPLSPEKTTALPAPYGLPKRATFSPVKKVDIAAIQARQNLQDIMSTAAEQLKRLDKLESPPYGKDDEDIEYYVGPERRELAKRASRLVGDVPDTFQRPYELQEWDLPPASEEDGILEETPPPRSASPVVSSPISPIYSPRFQKSIREHQYTDQFFDKDRPRATSMIKSGSKAVRLQRKSRPPGLEDIEERITEEQKADYYASPGRTNAGLEELFTESPPREGFITPPRPAQSPVSPAESPFSLKMRLFQGELPPYDSRDEMDIFTGRRTKTIQRHSAPPGLHKLREVPPDYREEDVPFLSQVEKATGEWSRPPRKIRKAIPAVSPVREDPMHVPGMLEVDDTTGFRRVREGLERKFADLPELYNIPPDDLLDTQGYIPPQDEGDNQLDQQLPENLPSPIRPIAEVPGWTTPPRLKTKKIERRFRSSNVLPERSENVRLRPQLLDLLGQEMPPEDIVYSPPHASPKSLAQFIPQAASSARKPPIEERAAPRSPDSSRILTVVEESEFDSLGEEQLPEDLQFSPIYSSPEPQQRGSPVSSPESPFSFRMRVLQGEVPPYDRRDEMELFIKKPVVIKRYSAKPGVHKIREVPDDYREEDVPFLSQVEKATGEWKRKPRKMRITVPDVSPVREDPMNVPGMFEVDDTTGFRKVRQQLEKRFAHLPELPSEPPADLIGTPARIKFQREQTELDKTPPRGLPSPVKPPTVVPGWTSPQHLQKKKISPKPYEVKLIPGLRDVLFQEMPPPELVRSPPRSPGSRESPVTPDRYMQPSPRPSPYLTYSPSYTPTLVQGEAGQVFKKPSKFLELEMAPDEFMPSDTPPSPSYWDYKRQARSVPVSPDTTIDSFEDLEKELMQGDVSGERPQEYSGSLTPTRRQAALEASRTAQRQLMELEETPPRREEYTGSLTPTRLEAAINASRLAQRQLMEEAVPQSTQEFRTPRRARREYEKLQFSPDKYLEELEKFEKTFAGVLPEEEEAERGSVMERIQELIADVPEPHLPKRKPTVSPEMKQVTPKFSPKLPAVGQFSDQIDEEYVPQGVWGYSSPKTPPKTPPRTPPQPSPYAGRDIFEDEAGDAYYIEEIASPDLVRSPTSPPTPPNIADYYRPHTPPSPDSPTGLSQSLREHEYTKHYYDRARKLASGRLQVKNKMVPLSRHSKGPAFSPVKESYRESSPPQRRSPPVADLIPISPVRTREIIEEAGEPVDLPILDKSVPQRGLDISMADRGIHFTSSPKTPRLVMPAKYQYVSPPKPQTVFDEDLVEGDLFETTPPNEFTPPELYLSPQSGPRSPIDSPSFQRSIREHQYTPQFFDEDRPYSSVVRSGKRAVRLDRQAPQLDDVPEQEQLDPRTSGSPNYELPMPNYYGSPGRTYVRTPNRAPRRVLEKTVIVEEEVDPANDDVAGQAPQRDDVPEQEQLDPRTSGSRNYDLPMPNYYGSPGRTYVRTPNRGPRRVLEKTVIVEEEVDPADDDVAGFQWMG